MRMDEKKIISQKITLVLKELNMLDIESQIHGCEFILDVVQKEGNKFNLFLIWFNLTCISADYLKKYIKRTCSTSESKREARKQMDDNLTLLAETKLKMEILREVFEQWEGGSDITNSRSYGRHE